MTDAPIPARTTFPPDIDNDNNVGRTPVGVSRYDRRWLASIGTSAATSRLLASLVPAGLRRRILLGAAVGDESEAVGRRLGMSVADVDTLLAEGDGRHVERLSRP